MATGPAFDQDHFARGSVRLPRMQLDAPPERPLTVLIDTREQTPPPWPKGVVVERATLETGDYCTPALRGVAAIERKSPGDMMGSFTHERVRFGAELERAARLDAFAIVVESSLEECLALTGARWESIVGSLASFAARGVFTCFLGSPLAAGRFIAGLLLRWERTLLPTRTRAERLRDAAHGAGLVRDPCCGAVDWHGFVLPHLRNHPGET